MQVELTGLDERTMNRARYQLDEEGIKYVVSLWGGLVFESDDAQACTNFVRVALRDPNAKAYRVYR